MARETVVTATGIVVAGGWCGEMMLTFVVHDDNRIAVRIVHVVQRGPERGDAQYQEQQTRGVAHQLCRQPQLVLHHCESNGHPGGRVKPITGTVPGKQTVRVLGDTLLLAGPRPSGWPFLQTPGSFFRTLSARLHRAAAPFACFLNPMGPAHGNRVCHG